MPPSTAASCCRATIARATTRIPAASIGRCSKACSSERWRSNVLGEPTVKLGPPVSKEPECRAVLLRLRQVERRDQHPTLVRPELFKNVAALVADEAVAVEALAVLGADAVGGDHRNDVRHGVADHRQAVVVMRAVGFEE